eukprot:275901-Pelagomonas_calceolata.AAC.1
MEGTGACLQAGTQWEKEPPAKDWPLIAWKEKSSLKRGNQTSHTRARAGRILQLRTYLGLVRGSAVHTQHTEGCRFPNFLEDLMHLHHWVTETVSFCAGEAVAGKEAIEKLQMQSPEPQ